MSRQGNTVYVMSAEEKKHSPITSLPVTLKEKDGEFVVIFHKPTKYVFIYQVGREIFVRRFDNVSRSYFNYCVKALAEGKLEKA